MSSIAFSLIFMILNTQSDSKDRVLEKRSSQIVLNYKIKLKKQKFIVRKMKSGITQRVLYSTILYKKGESMPISTHIRYCSITWDLWDENYQVRCRVPGKTLKSTIKTDKKLLLFLSTLQNYPLAPYSLISTTSTYYVSIKIQLNPISPKLLQKVRLWLRQSDNSTYSTNYFGSILSLFVSKNIGGNDFEQTVKTGEIQGKDIN